MHYVSLSVMKNFKPSIKAAWLLCSGPGQHQRVCFFNSPLRMGQPLWLPTKTNPLANIVSEASPQRFQPDLNHTAQPKLTQTKFVLDPGVGKLCYPGPLLVDLTSLFSLHLRFKRCQLSRLVHAQQRAPFLTRRTAASLKRTAPTIRRPRPVAAFHPAFLSLLCFKLQKLACRTGVTVRTGVIGKSLGIKLFTHPAPLERIPRGLVGLSQGSNQINAFVCHGLNRGLRRIRRIHHHLLGLFSQITLDSLYRRFQFSRVTGGLAHSKRHNDLRLGIGGNLNVIAGAKSPFCLYHVARLRVGGTGAKLFFLSLCFLLRQLFGPSPLKLLQLLERLLKPLVLLAQRSLSCLSHPLTQLLGARISHRFHLLLSLFKVRFKRLMAPKTLIGGRGFNLGPIMHHTLKGDQSLMAEHPQDLNEQSIERLLMRDAKIRQRVIVDHFHPRQPLISRVILTQPRNLARRTDSILIGIDPQTDQHLGIPHRSARFSFQRANLGIEGLHIQLPHQLPDRSHRMLLADKRLYIHRAQQQLVSFDGFAPNGFPLSILLKGGIPLHGISSTPFEPRSVLCEASTYFPPPTRCSRLSPFPELEPEEPGKSDRTVAARWPVRRLESWLGIPYKAPPVVGHWDTPYHSYIAMARTFYNFFTASLFVKGGTPKRIFTTPHFVSLGPSSFHLLYQTIDEAVVVQLFHPMEIP